MSRQSADRDCGFRLKYVFYKIHKNSKINYVQDTAQLGEVTISMKQKLAKMHKIVYFLTQKNQVF